jgi:hypothetical protein
VPHIRHRLFREWIEQHDRLCFLQKWVYSFAIDALVLNPIPDGISFYSKNFLTNETMSLESCSRILS